MEAQKEKATHALLKDANLIINGMATLYKAKEQKKFLKRLLTQTLIDPEEIWSAKDRQMLFVIIDNYIDVLKRGKDWTHEYMAAKIMGVDDEVGEAPHIPTWAKRGCDSLLEDVERPEDDQYKVYVMDKSQFEFAEDGVGLAECPNCGDGVVYGSDCVACDADFEFTDREGEQGAIEADSYKSFFISSRVNDMHKASVSWNILISGPSILRVLNRFTALLLSKIDLEKIEVCDIIIKVKKMIEPITPQE